LRRMVLYPEDGFIMFIQIICKAVIEYTVPKSKRTYFKESMLFKNKLVIQRQCSGIALRSLSFLNRDLQFKNLASK
jgi:hypothetical protein